MSDGAGDPAAIIDALLTPDRLWTRAEVLERPSPVPPLAGVYGPRPPPRRAEAKARARKRPVLGS